MLTINGKPKLKILLKNMGPKHPINLKLKKHKIWNMTLYKYNSSNILNLTKEHKNIIKLINYYFQYVLISIPKINYENNMIKIKIYYYIKPTTLHHSIRPFLQNGLALIKFESLLKNFYGKSVELQLIRLKNPIFNANILAQFIGINLKKYSISKI